MCASTEVRGKQLQLHDDSNIRIDAAAELCLLEYGQRLTHQARNLLTAPGQSTGASLYHHARKGAQALGHPPATLTPGARADIVTLRPGQPTTAARSGDRLLDSWIFARAQIDSVWCAGVRRVTAGLHHARPAIEARYTQLLKALLD